MNTNSTQVSRRRFLAGAAGAAGAFTIVPRCVLGGAPGSSNFSYAARLAEFILLGNVAIRAQKKILWDGPNMKAKNAPEADEFISHESHYRPGWTL